MAAIGIGSGVGCCSRVEEDDDFEANPVFKFLKGKMPMFWVVFFFVQMYICYTAIAI